MSQSDDTDAEILAEARAEASIPTSRAGADDAVEADQAAALEADQGPAHDADEVLAHDGAAPPAPKGSLWRDRNFLTMWSGQALAQVGSQVTELAIPVLAVLLLGASELEVGFLNA
ncbi:MAG: hypothetical protein ACXWZG_06865, partial [Microbacterium sp.]